MKIDRIVGNIVIFMLLIATVLPVAVTATDDWPMFHHDLGHTGYSQSQANGAYNVKWTYSALDTVSSSPAVVDDYLYIGAAEGKLYCINAINGEYQWEHPPGSPSSLLVISSPAVVDGRVYYGHADCKIYCVDAYNGQEIWNYTTGSLVLSSPAVYQDKVFITSLDGKLYCLNATDGILIGSVAAGGTQSSPAIYENKVYVGAFDGKVYCFNIETAQLEWTFPTGYWVLSSPTVADGKVFIGATMDGMLYCLNATDGTELWSKSIATGNYEIDTSPAVAYGNVYVGVDSNTGNPCKVVCLDSEDGQEIWNYTNPYEGFSSSPVIADYHVFIGSDDGNIYCFNATNGDLIFSYETDEAVTSSPAIVDSVVYFGSSDHNV